MTKILKIQNERIADVVSLNKNNVKIMNLKVFGSNSPTNVLNVYFRFLACRRMKRSGKEMVSCPVAEGRRSAK